MPGHLARACPNPNNGMQGPPRGLGAPRGGFGGGFAPRGGFAGGPRPATCYKVSNFSLIGCHVPNLPKAFHFGNTSAQGPRLH